VFEGKGGGKKEKKKENHAHHPLGDGFYVISDQVLSHRDAIKRKRGGGGREKKKREINDSFRLRICSTPWSSMKSDRVNAPTFFGGKRGKRGKEGKEKVLHS